MGPLRTVSEAAPGEPARGQSPGRPVRPVSGNTLVRSGSQPLGMLSRREQGVRRVPGVPGSAPRRWLSPARALLAAGPSQLLGPPGCRVRLRQDCVGPTRPGDEELAHRVGLGTKCKMTGIISSLLAP